jgi:potassium-transporting ATPase KdpC subunit
MFAQFRPAIVALLLLTLLTGVLYPLAITGIAAAVFPRQAGGSMLTDGNDHPIGSALIGQFFDDPRYFWPRPSATSPVPYTAFNADKSTGSSGSNWGPTNPALIQAVKDRISALQKADPDVQAPTPVDLVTASASGLDPDISRAAAEYQVPRVARLRHMTENDVRRLVAACTDGRQLGILGEPRVNVLRLNLALNAAAPLAPPAATSTAGAEEP